MNTATSIPEARQRPSIQTEASPDQPNPGRMQHPNFRRSLFAQPPHPWDSKLRPLSNKLTSDLAQESRKLYDKWQDAIAYQTKVPMTPKLLARSHARVSRRSRTQSAAKLTPTARQRSWMPAGEAQRGNRGSRVARLARAIRSGTERRDSPSRASQTSMRPIGKSLSSYTRRTLIGSTRNRSSPQSPRAIEHEHDDHAFADYDPSRVPGLTSNVLPDGYSEKPCLREQ